MHFVLACAALPFCCLCISSAFALLQLVSLPSSVFAVAPVGESPRHSCVAGAQFTFSVFALSAGWSLCSSCCLCFPSLAARAAL